MLINRFFKDLTVFDSFLFRYCKDQCVYWLIDWYLRNAKRLSLQCIFSLPYCFGCEYGLVEIDDAVVLWLELSYLCFDIQSPLFILLLLGWIKRFNELDLLALDLVEMIDLSEQCRVDAVGTKVSVKEDTALF